MIVISEANFFPTNIEHPHAFVWYVDSRKQMELASSGGDVPWITTHTLSLSLSLSLSLYFCIIHLKPQGKQKSERWANQANKFVVEANVFKIIVCYEANTS